MQPKILQLIAFSWSIPVWPTLLTLLAACLYLRGWRLARFTRPDKLPPWRAVCFLAGLFTIWFALASPVDALDNFLILAHMTQHLLLISLAPPLLLLGRPVVPLLRGLPRALVRDELAPWMNTAAFRFLQRLFASPLFGWLAFVTAIVVWHMPAAYELTLRSAFWHDFEHGCFLFSALAFWWYLIRPWPSHVRGTRWLILPYVIGANFMLGAVGLVITRSPSVIYSSYAAMPRIFSLGALTDQSLAGAEMLFVGLITALAVLWPTLFDLLSETPHRAERAAAPAVRQRVLALQRKRRDFASALTGTRPGRRRYTRLATYVVAILLISGLAIFSQESGDSDDDALCFRQPAGSFILSLFASTPLTPGETDFEVAVERPHGQGLITDANVKLLLTPAGGGDPISVPATHHGPSKFLESASVTLPRSGNWRVTVTAVRGDELAKYSADLDVLPADAVPSQRKWVWGEAGFVLLLFGLHQWRKHTYQRGLQSRANAERRGVQATAA